MESESQEFTVEDIILYDTIANSQANAHPVEVDCVRLFNLNSIDICTYYMQIPVPTFDVPMMNPGRERRERLRATHRSNVSGAPVCEEGTTCASCFKTYKDCPGHMTYVQASKIFIVPIHYDFVCNVLNSIVTLQLWENEGAGGARSVTHPHGRPSPFDSIGHSAPSKDKTLRYCRARAGGSAVAINACLAKRGVGGGQRVPSQFTSFNAIFSIVTHFMKARTFLDAMPEDDARRDQVEAYVRRLEASISHVVPMLPYPRRLEKNKEEESRAFSPVNDLYDKIFIHSSYMLSKYIPVQDEEDGDEAEADGDEQTRMIYFNRYLRPILSQEPVILPKDSPEAIARRKDFSRISSNISRTTRSTCFRPTTQRSPSWFT